MSEYSLTKRIQGLDLTKKVFEFYNLAESAEHEKLVPHYKEQLEAEGHEIYEIKGHQFMTNDGVYVITHKSEINYGE
jgi:hypothetical protein